MYTQAKLMDVKTLVSINAATEHELVVDKYQTLMQLMKKKPATPRSKINIESLETESTRLLFQSRLAEKIHRNGIEEKDNVEQTWKKIRNNIIDSAMEVVGTRKVNTNGRRNNKPWFTEEVRTLTKEKKEAYIKYRNQTSQQEYKQI